MKKFKDFQKEMMDINKESNKKMAELFNDTIKDQVERIFREQFNQHINEMVIDRLEKFEYSISREQDKISQNIHDRINQAGEYVVELKDELSKDICAVKEDVQFTKSKVDTLEFNRKSNELARYIHTKIHRSTGIKKNTDEYTLFFGRLNRALQAEIKERYGINRYGLLPMSELEDCKKFIDGWYPASNYRSKYMQEYRKRDDKGNLPCTLKKAYDRYLEVHEGVI